MHKITFFWGVRAEILLLCAEKLPFLGFVQKYYWPGARGSWILVQSHFWGPWRNIGFSEKYSPLTWYDTKFIFTPVGPIIDPCRASYSLLHGLIFCPAGPTIRPCRTCYSPLHSLMFTTCSYMVVHSRFTFSVLSWSMSRTMVTTALATLKTTNNHPLLIENMILPPPTWLTSRARAERTSKLGLVPLTEENQETL